VAFLRKPDISCFAACLDQSMTVIGLAATICDVYQSGPIAIRHLLVSHLCGFMGTSQPCPTKISAILIALSRSRMGLGPKRQISRARMMGWVQLF
jgi:hypothetical protein